MKYVQPEPWESELRRGIGKGDRTDKGFKIREKNQQTLEINTKASGIHGEGARGGGVDQIGVQIFEVNVKRDFCWGTPPPRQSHVIGMG